MCVNFEMRSKLINGWEPSNWSSLSVLGLVVQSVTRNLCLVKMMDFIAAPVCSYIWVLSPSKSGYLNTCHG